MRFNVVLAATISSVAALPAEPTLEARAVNCAKITGALSVLKNLGPPATTFCSSFLKVPATATITTTTTSTRYHSHHVHGDIDNN
ncbi:hypothetical protein N0V86_005627 [Didymella sp. IMI 355093]|nr:hypothetical protein N0V86_005627 [Didymella sp. IMI 355093]